jgi:hypothetical protein
LSSLDVIAVSASPLPATDVFFDVRRGGEPVTGDFDRFEPAFSGQFPQVAVGEPVPAGGLGQGDQFVFVASLLIRHLSFAHLPFSFTYAAIIADFGLDVYRRAFLYHGLQSLQHPGAEAGPGAPGVGDAEH